MNSATRCISCGPSILQNPNRIMYRSTNRKSNPAFFREAVLASKPDDGGLYMPERFPQFTHEELKAMKSRDYPQTAYLFLEKFLKGEMPVSTLSAMLRSCYDFEVPLEKVTDNTYILRLDRGPTAAFKDFGALPMACITSYYAGLEGREITVFVATSGDTGAAIARAFHNRSGVRVIVAFPENEVEKWQRIYMTTLGGNVAALAVPADFDTLQMFVNRALADPELQHLNITAANSINISRLLPQSIYYVYAYSRLMDLLGDNPLLFSVPSANLGNLTGGLIAKACGIPARFIAATNANGTFPCFWESGMYVPNPSVQCISNSMNIGDPNNIPRIVDMYGGHMDENKKITVAPDMEKLRQDIVFSKGFSDSWSEEVIRRHYQRYGKVLEHHGALGVAALAAYRRQTGYDGIAVCVETAHPAKFLGEVNGILDIKVEMPESMKQIKEKEELAIRMPAVYEKIKEFLLNFRQ